MKKVAVVTCSGIHEEGMEQTWAFMAKEVWDWSAVLTSGMGLTDRPRGDEYEFDRQRRPGGSCELGKSILW